MEFFMEQTLETNAAGLLDGVTDIIRQYEARWQKTGEKYNIFKVAGIACKELIMCRVLADLLNPQGKHCQGGRYLSLFWEAITSKLPAGLALDVEHTRVATERVTDKGRRIDIALEDGKIFVPVEVKIEAPDQQNQLVDYFDFAKTKNGNNHVPVLYLTLDGHEPPDHSKDGLSENDYVRLSFKDDIIAWLEACAQDKTTETTMETPMETPTPVRENLKQLTAAVKSLCGKSEDTEMEEAIFKLVTKDDDSVRAALAISGVTDFRGMVLKTFTDTVLPLVKASFPSAVMTNGSNYDYDWHYIEIPVREGNYLLQVNYDWTSVWLSASASNKTDSTSQEWVNLNKKMKELLKFEGESVPKERYVWRGEDISWPSLESYVYNDELNLYFAHLSKVPPQEIADRIVSIVRELESADKG
jgi:hypothetical protein